VLPKHPPVLLEGVVGEVRLGVQLVPVAREVVEVLLAGD